MQRSLLNGDSVTGVTLFRLVEQMDAGPILLQEEYFPDGTETAGELLDILAEKGSKLFLLGVKCIIEGTCSFIEQNSESATYAPKITNKEAEVSWQSSAERIVNTVRALNPSPGAFLHTGSKRLKIWSARACSLSGAPGEVLGFDDGFPMVGTAEGAVVLLAVQPEGKRKLDGSEWARAAPEERRFSSLTEPDISVLSDLISRYPSQNSPLPDGRKLLPSQELSVPEKRNGSSISPSVFPALEKKSP